MNLHEKVLITIGVAVLCIIILLYGVSQTLLLSSYAELEEQETHRNVERTLSVMSDDLSKMNSTLGDWSSWDDTYEFVGGTYPDYAEDNLVDATFENLRLNLMLLTNTSGEVVFGKAYDLQAKREVPVPESLLAHIAQNTTIISHPTAENSVAGLVLLPEGPLLIVSKPILKSNGEGPLRGALVMGRYLNAPEIERLAEITHLAVNVYQINDSERPPAVQAAESSLSVDAPIFIQPQNEESIIGYGLVADIYGHPGLIVAIDMPRPIYNQGQETLRYLILAILTVGLTFSLVIVVLVERVILSPLARLNQNVAKIGASGNLSRRVPITGKDEIADLAVSVNGMLISLEQAQNALRESEEKFRELAELLPATVWEMDEQGFLTFVNNKAFIDFGYTQADFEAGLNAFQMLIPEERERGRENISGILRGEDPGGVEYRALRKDGSTFPVIIYASPVIRSGKVCGLRGIIVDITNKKQEEEERERLLNELEAKNREMEHFTYTVSHDLRSPLITIQGFTAMLRQDLERNDLEKAATDLEYIARAGAKMDKLLRDTLQLSRIGRMVNPPEDVPFGAIVRGALEQTAGDIHAHSIEVSVAEDFPTVHVDRMRIEELLVNLIGNSIKYRGDQPSPKIEIGYRMKDGEPVFFVQDNGIGIAKSEQEKVFDLFYRVDTSSEGTGAGLAIVKRIIEVHNGRIWIESELGKGTTVLFTLPVV